MIIWQSNLITAFVRGHVVNKLLPKFVQQGSSDHSKLLIGFYKNTCHPFLLFGDGCNGFGFDMIQEKNVLCRWS
jgi:hypothetical protein